MRIQTPCSTRLLQEAVATLGTNWPRVSHGMHAAVDKRDGDLMTWLAETHAVTAGSHNSKTGATSVAETS
jgi:hypothetical protein